MSKTPETRRLLPEHPTKFTALRSDPQFIARPIVSTIFCNYRRLIAKYSGVLLKSLSGLYADKSLYLHSIT